MAFNNKRRRSTDVDKRERKELVRSNRKVVFITAFLTTIVVAFFYLFTHWSVGFTSSVNFCTLNCHEMQESYRDWLTSSHNDSAKGVVADCADCHLPTGFVPKIIAKTYYGIRDSYVHYFGDVSNLDRRELAKKARKNITDDSCRKCHKNLFPTNLPRGGLLAHRAIERGEKKKCVECHQNFVHNYKEYFGEGAS